MTPRTGVVIPRAARCVVTPRGWREAIHKATTYPDTKHRLTGEPDHWFYLDGAVTK